MNTPIHDLQIEQTVIAALMTVAGSFSEVESLLTEEDFHATRHKLIFQAVLDLDSQDSPYDAVLVNQWLEMRNLSEAAGGEQYIMQILSDAPSSFYNLIAYVEKLRDLTTC